MDKIQIRAGANITKILQSTVNIPQAFTELAKNSLQNKASFCEIELKDNIAIITDDGIGFDHEKDDQGMNAFERYFVFGNSYASENGGIRLGHMGIGGKVSNDKLSHEEYIDWTIETKNQHGKCFLVDYNPDPEAEFLTDYEPSIEEFSPEDSTIETSTGSKIRILSLKSDIQRSGWNLEEIKDELASFFASLIIELNKQNKKFEIILNKEKINFSHKLPGFNIPEFSKKFDFILNGKKEKGHVDFKMSFVRDERLIKHFPIKELYITSDVKICKFKLSNTNLFYKTLDKIVEEQNILFLDSDKIFSLFQKLIGYISCKELSTKLDSIGQPAKDLSHHALRSDHPITQPFYEAIYEYILRWLIEYFLEIDEDKISILDALTLEISDLIIEQFDDDLAELLLNNDGIFIQDDISDEVEEDTPQSEFQGLVKQTLASKEETINDPEEIRPEKPPPPPKPDHWKDRHAKKPQKHKKIIPYSIFDFGEDQINTISKLESSFKFRVLINSGNPKFKNLQNEPNPFLLSLHICECLIRESLLYKNSLYTHQDLDQKISEFYAEKYIQLKQKMYKKLHE